MIAEEATVVAATEEAIVAAEAEEAIEDKDKSSHRLIGGSNKNEGSDKDSGNVSSGGFDDDSDEIPVTTRDSDDGSDEIPVAPPTRFQRRLRRGSGGYSDEVETVGRWLENSSE